MIESYHKTRENDVSKSVFGYYIITGGNSITRGFQQKVCETVSRFSLEKGVKNLNIILLDYEHRDIFFWGKRCR